MVCACGGRHMQNTFVSVDQIITNNLDLLFGGMEIKSAHMFRTTRNADVARNEEEAEDLLEMITDEMRELRFAPFVRLEVDCEMPQDVIQRLSNELGLSNKDDVYTVCGQMALGDLDSLPVKLGVDSPLIFTPWSPKTHPRLQGSVDIFDVIRKGDILVQHPYHSFVTSTQHFVEAASNDPRVLTSL
jgi:polyphosphate kinase